MIFSADIKFGVHWQPEGTAQTETVVQLEHTNVTAEPIEGFVLQAIPVCDIFLILTLIMII